MDNEKLILLKNGQFVLREYSDLLLGDQQAVIDRLGGNVGDHHPNLPTGEVTSPISPNGSYMGDKVDTVTCKFWSGTLSASAGVQRRYVAIEIPFFPINCAWVLLQDETHPDTCLNAFGMRNPNMQGAEFVEGEKDYLERVRKGIWIPGFSLNHERAKDWIIRRTLGSDSRKLLKTVESANILMPVPGRTVISMVYDCHERAPFRQGYSCEPTHHYRIGSFMEIGETCPMPRQDRTAFYGKALALSRDEAAYAEKRIADYRSAMGNLMVYAPPFPNVNNEGTLCMGDAQGDIAKAMLKKGGTEFDIAESFLTSFMSAPCSNHWTSRLTNKICALDVDKIPARATATLNYFLEFCHRERYITNPETLALTLGRRQ